MLTSAELSNRYFDWLKENITFEQLNQKTTRIDMPFLDLSADEIEMYAIQQDDGQLTLTDDGWTIDNLEGNGIYITKSTKKKRLLHQQLLAYGISYENCELKINTTIENFAEAKHRLLQAILFVNDMFMLSSSTRINYFVNDISNFFVTNKIRTSKNISYIGESGLTHKYDFLIPGLDQIPMKLFKTMSSPNNPLFAKALLADVEQTRPVLEDPGQFYVFMNDQNPQQPDRQTLINPEIIALFTNSNIQPVRYSERETFIAEFTK